MSKKSGFPIERSLRVRANAQRNLAQLYDHARYYGLGHSEILARHAAILESADVCNAPHWVSSYLDGYWRCLMDGAYRHDLIFGGMKDGRFYSTHHDRVDYYEKHGISACDYADDGLVTARGHYWSEAVTYNKKVMPFFHTSHRNPQ